MPTTTAIPMIPGCSFDHDFLRLIKETPESRFTTARSKSCQSRESTGYMPLPLRLASLSDWPQLCEEIITRTKQNNKHSRNKKKPKKNLKRHGESKRCGKEMNRRTKEKSDKNQPLFFGVLGQVYLDFELLEDGFLLYDLSLPSSPLLLRLHVGTPRDITTVVSTSAGDELYDMPCSTCRSCNKQKPMQHTRLCIFLCICSCFISS
jgi:hypothetical protein